MNEEKGKESKKSKKSKKGKTKAEQVVEEWAARARRPAPDYAVDYASGRLPSRPILRAHVEAGGTPPPRELEGVVYTHGFYHGDDRDSRLVHTGFQPAHVLFVLPVFLTGLPEVRFEKKGPVVSEPPPPVPPEVVEDGFVVDRKLNEAGRFYLYLCWYPRPEDAAPGDGDGLAGDTEEVEVGGGL